MSIKNEPKIKNPIIAAIREQLEIGELPRALDVNWICHRLLQGEMISARFALSEDNVKRTV